VAGSGPARAGLVIHTLGAPLWNTFGGGWIYGMRDDIVDIGLVTGLDYADPSPTRTTTSNAISCIPRSVRCSKAAR
jgi:flavin-dependent dehydrogenase